MASRPGWRYATATRRRSSRRSACATSARSAWRDGIDVAHLTDDRVAVTPPLPGARDTRWVLVAGRYLLRPDVVIDVIGAVRARCTPRSSSSPPTGSPRCIAGSAPRTAYWSRTFGYVGQTGEVTSWHGDPDPAERDAGLPATFDEETSVLVSEQDVLTVANAWSLDPTTLTGKPAPGTDPHRRRRLRRGAPCAST